MSWGHVCPYFPPILVVVVPIPFREARPRHGGLFFWSFSMLVPAGHAWRNCPRLKLEQSCLQRRICPATEKELEIRECDVCPVGTRRAYSLAMNHRKRNAMAMGAMA